jgi:hypothetical protein
MGRSLGFASTTCDSFRPFKTRFRYGSTPEVLNLATDGNSPAHYAKGTRSPVIHPKTDHRAPTACRCMVSGSLNSPNRGSFHRSLALLFTIGRRGVLSLGGWSPQLHTEFHELRATLERQHRVSVFAYRTITFYGRTFQTVPLTVALLMLAPTTPGSKPPGLGYIRFRSPLLTESRLISFPAGT